MSEPWLNVAAWRPCTEAEGPGRRAALWVQGCDKRCAGCCNPQFLPLQVRTMMPARAVVEQLRGAQTTHGIEGVTFLGGEPMLQAVGLAAVAREAQAVGLSVMVFTGYTIEELDELQLPGARALIAATDVLVDGPFVGTAPDQKRRWIGSTNQRVFYLTSRYNSQIEELTSQERDLEVRIGVDASIRVNGWPTRFLRPTGSAS